MRVYKICVCASLRLTLDCKEVPKCAKIFEGESFRMLNIAFLKKNEVTGAYFLRLLAQGSLGFLQRSPAWLILKVKTVDMGNITRWFH